MKILSFDNSRCVSFINKNTRFFSELFWQEFCYLSAWFYCYAMNAYVKNKTKNDPNKYIGNIEAAQLLVKEARKEIEGLRDLMIGQIAFDQEKSKK